MNRLSPEEVEAIVRMVSQRKAVAYGSGQTIDSLAHALGVSPHQVEDHLRDVRNGSVFTDREAFRRSMIGLGAAAGLLVLLVAGSLVFGGHGAPADAGAAMTPVAQAGPVYGGAAFTPSIIASGPATPRLVENPIVPPPGGPAEQRVDPPPAYWVDSQTGRERMVGEAGEKARREATVALAW